MRTKNTGSITSKEIIALIEKEYNIKIRNPQWEIKYTGGNGSDIKAYEVRLGKLEFDVVVKKESQEILG